MTAHVRRLLLAGALALAASPAASAAEKKNLGVKGSNSYFPLTPGYQLSYHHGKDTDTLTVLNETKIIDGVESRIIEDREMRDGQLVELTRDYYAIDAATNDVYYMGEDVDVYKNGKVVGHEGAWLSGRNGAQFGLMMPGTPKAGQKFFQERAPGAGEDRAEIVSVAEKITTPAGTFANCVHVVEIAGKARDHKWYAPGVGQVKDGALVLVKYGK